MATVRIRRACVDIRTQVSEACFLNRSVSNVWVGNAVVPCHDRPRPLSQPLPFLATKNNEPLWQLVLIRLATRFGNISHRPDQAWRGEDGSIASVVHNLMSSRLHSVQTFVKILYAEHLSPFVTISHCDSTPALPDNQSP
jgi:hypothetical protein